MRYVLIREPSQISKASHFNKDQNSLIYGTLHLKKKYCYQYILAIYATKWQNNDLLHFTQSATVQNYTVLVIVY